MESNLFSVDIKMNSICMPQLISLRNEKNRNTPTLPFLAINYGLTSYRREF
jgi:hypothetical protein